MFFVECGIFFVECGMFLWSVEFFFVECGMFFVECGMFFVECGMFAVTSPHQRNSVDQLAGKHSGPNLGNTLFHYQICSINCILSVASGLVRYMVIPNLVS